MIKDLMIGAIPARESDVWQASSEKVPHLTILYLGDQPDDFDIGSVYDYVEHVANTVLEPFYLDVERRGTLGDKNADVIFFSKSSTRAIENARAYLLSNELIRKAYLSVDQFPKWTPHLTLGYPEKPAKVSNKQPLLHYVKFDRIALWTNDYSGPEFELTYRNYNNEGEEVSMSTSINEDFLAHYGIKGMKWGVRRKNPSGPAPVEVRSGDGRKIKTRGGERQPASNDALRAAVLKQVAKKSTTDALSTKDLQELVTRLNLEQQYSRLRPKRPSEQVASFISTTLLNIGKEQASKYAREAVSNQIGEVIKSRK
jgi:2'-5' RNA ligase